MSGHSKWSKIKQKKGKEDQRRGKIFTKLGKAITIAVRQGGADLEMNFALRLAVEKAKTMNMPKENIERAVKRGSGELDDGVVLEEVLYEGFGPNGVAVLVDTLTDNKNRTVSEVKNIFSKSGGSLGSPGSVQWQFERKGIVMLTSNKKQKVADWETLQLELMDAGVEDIKDSEDGVEIICSVEDLQNILTLFEKNSIVPDDSGVEWVAKDLVEVDDVTSEKIEKMTELFDECDDVREVYTNQA